MFGTDGIRGIWGQNITPMLFFGLGLAASEVFGGTAVVARDSRVSGEELQSAVTDGLISGGVNVIDCGMAPSPALAAAVSLCNANFGVMITASHNPPEYNGIKFFDAFGCKISRDSERLIEFYLAHPPLKKFVGGKKSTRDIISDYAKKFNTRFEGCNLDLCFGAGCALCGHLDARTFNDIPDGTKINFECGALFPQFIRERTPLGWGFALDGDGDRLAVSYDGEILDGDSVLFNLALARGVDKVVTTVMSNSALINALEKADIAVETTPVGDKYVGERMRSIGCVLGGEQSGHYILSDNNCTGDALGAAAFLVHAYKDKKPIKLELFPQTRFDYPKRIAAMPVFDSTVALLRARFDGRLLVRLSGTEPKVRFMAEHRDKQKLDSFVSELKKFLDTLVEK